MSLWKKQNSNVKLIILLLIVLALILAAFFVVKMMKENDGEIAGTEVLKDESVGFNTPVGKLNYPFERAQYAKIKESTDGAGYTATLYGKAGKKEFKLFSIYINEQMLESFLIGNVTDTNANTYSISMAIEELEESDGWDDTTDEEKDLFYAMQEDVNYIIEQIEALPGFTPAY